MKKPPDSKFLGDATAAILSRKRNAALRGTLFRKYLVLFIGLVSAALLLNAAVELSFQYRDNRALLARLQLEKADLARQRIEQFTDDILRQLDWVTAAQWAGQAADRRHFDYIILLRQIPAVTELRQLDADGREQLKVSRLAIDVVGSESDFSRDPVFTETRAQKVWFSPVHFRVDSEPYMTLAIAANGRARGVTVAEVNLKLIWDVVTSMKLGSAGYAYVVDRMGRLIAHPDISLVLRNTSLLQLPQVAAGLRELEAGDAAAAAAVAPDLEGRRVLSAHAALPALGWLVFIEVPMREALAPLLASTLHTLVVLAAGLVLSGLAALLMVRRMVGPIWLLHNGAARIGAGDLEARIEVHTGDELESLAIQFNRMARQLRQSYAGLERTVEERTRDLAEKSRQLETASAHKSQFLATMSHELRTPLNAILGYTELLVDGLYGELPERPRGVLERVQENGRHLLALINNVLDLAKIEAGQLVLAIDDYHPVELVQSVVSSMEALARMKGLSFACRTEGNIPPARGDVQRLRQVLVNLVGNAIKFIDAGGVEVTTSVVDGRLRIAVRDSGPGISPQDHEFVFEEFRQLDNSSTQTKGGGGLGLPIARQIVELHGGRLTLVSTSGQGATFVIDIPVRVAATAEMAP